MDYYVLITFSLLPLFNSILKLQSNLSVKSTVLSEPLRYLHSCRQTFSLFLPAHMLHPGSDTHKMHVEMLRLFDHFYFSLHTFSIASAFFCIILNLYSSSIESAQNKPFSSQYLCSSVSLFRENANL